jgi:3,6-anhydro-L-galactonate cycloisomerase
VEKHAFALDPYLERPQIATNGTGQPTRLPGSGPRFDRQALARAAVD